MPKLPDHIKEIGEKYGLSSKTDLWDCQGVWVVYHKALERIAAENGVEWLEPQIVSTDAENDVALIAKGRLDDRFEWSVGEASSDNYPKRGKAKRYPWAMAEKRAKDRVILKLIGLAGHVYSEEESDDFKRSEPSVDNTRARVEPSKAGARDLYNDMVSEMRQCFNLDALTEWHERNQEEGLYDKLPSDWLSNLRDEYSQLKGKLELEVAA